MLERIGIRWFLFANIDFKWKNYAGFRDVAAHGEIFAALREVNAMLDLVKKETLRIDSLICTK